MVFSLRNNTPNERRNESTVWSTPITLTSYGLASPILAASGPSSARGAGRGALTLALADLIGRTGEIFALDRDGNALKANARNMRAQFPQCSIHYQVADFTQALDLPPLDGILIANGLHFQRNPLAVLRLGHCYLQTDGRVVVVEYNVTKASGAVPFPVPYPRWYRLAEDAGFRHTALLATRPSRTLREIYSAVSW